MKRTKHTWDRTDTKIASTIVGILMLFAVFCASMYYYVESTTSHAADKIIPSSRYLGEGWYEWRVSTSRGLRLCLERRAAGAASSSPAIYCEITR